MSVVARCNGVILVEEDKVVRVVDQGGGWLGTAVFVTGLLTAILLAAGIAIAASVMLVVGLGMIGGGLVVGALTVMLFRMRKQKLASIDGHVMLAFDFGSRSVLNKEGQRVAPLDQVRLTRTFQMGSSSKALALVIAGEKVVIARGNPFGDGIEGVEHALVSRGVASGG